MVFLLGSHFLPPCNKSQPRFIAAPPPSEKESVLPNLPLVTPPDAKEDFLNHHPPSPSPESSQPPDIFSAPPSRNNPGSAPSMQPTDDGSLTDRTTQRGSYIPFFGTSDVPNPRRNREPISRQNVINHEDSTAFRTKSSYRKSGQRQPNMEKRVRGDRNYRGR